VSDVSSDVDRLRHGAGNPPPPPELPMYFNFQTTQNCMAAAQSLWRLPGVIVYPCSLRSVFYIVVGCTDFRPRI